ncbi:lipopolysaccharide biosynthesis protein [Gordonia sp. FQ]|uniref:lipopolysaccharide biosynthesis protein n=1 Tax=Gordonia sp. FQ TaxID=3446634 RepID=UPI003F836742
MRDRLVVNASALMLSSLATGALGLVYWIAAGRLFDPASVGRASALISTATMLGSFSCLSLGGAYQRFLPLAGTATRSLVAGGYLLSGAVAVVLGAGFAWTPLSDRLLHSTGQRLAFPAMVVVFTAFALTDPVLTALRKAPSVATKNITFSLVKLLPLAVLGAGSAAVGIVFSWTLLALLAAAVFGTVAIRGAIAGSHGANLLPPVKELLSFQSAFFALMLVSVVTPLALPLIVVHQAGVSDNAYFNLAWTMCSAAGLLSGAAGSAFIVEVSVPGADRPALLRRYAPILGGVTAVTAVGLATGGPLVLWIAGGDYLAAGWKLMLVMALNTVIETVVTFYYTIAQLHRRLRLMLVSQVLIVAVTVGGAYLLVPRIGLVGAGLASLTASCLALAVVALPLVHGVRAIFDEVPPPSPVGETVVEIRGS